MLIVVSGTVGIGKTTVCKKVSDLARSLGYNIGGIITYKAPDNGIIIEDVRTGKRKVLASINDIYTGPRTKRYFFNPKGIDFGIRAIESGTSADVLLVDEIGHLELGGEGFTNVTKLVRAGEAANCILVIRQELLSTFLSQLESAPLIFETTIGNRDRLPQEIAGVLTEKLPRAPK